MSFALSCTRKSRELRNFLSELCGSWAKLIWALLTFADIKETAASQWPDMCNRVISPGRQLPDDFKGMPTVYSEWRCVYLSTVTGIEVAYNGIFFVLLLIQIDFFLPSSPFLLFWVHDKDIDMCTVVNAVHFPFLCTQERSFSDLMQNSRFNKNEIRVLVRSVCNNRENFWMRNSQDNLFCQDFSHTKTVGAAVHLQEGIFGQKRTYRGDRASAIGY